MAYDINSLIGNQGGAFATSSTVMLDTPTALESNVTLQPIESTVTLQPVSATVALEPVTSTVTTTSTVTSSSTIESGVRLTFANRFDSSADVCLNLNFGRLPPTRIRQPYKQHLGFSLFGIEIIALELCGELDTHVEDAPRRPAILGPTRREAEPHHDGKGLRIRIGG